MKYKHKEIPQVWKDKIADYLKSKGITDRTEFHFYDFPNDSVRIELEDGSYIRLNHTLVLVSETELGFFTEHCGYYIFHKDAVIKWKTKKVRRPI